VEREQRRLTDAIAAGADAPILIERLAGTQRHPDVGADDHQQTVGVALVFSQRDELSENSPLTWDCFPVRE
jgi:hypothetical protein